MGLQSTWPLIMLLGTCSTRATAIKHVTFENNNMPQSKFKCCEENEIMYYDSCKLKSEVSFSDVWYSTNNIPPIVEKKLNCDVKVSILTSVECKVLTDEHLFINSKKRIPPGKFCIDFIFFHNLTLAVACIKRSGNNNKNDVSTYGDKVFFFIILIPSLLFFFLTILVYALIKDLKNLHGKCHISHAAIMCVVNIITMIKKWPFDEHQWISCNVFMCAYVFQYAVIATIFWLNVLSFDIWWTFSGNRLSIHGINNKKKKDAKKFIIYSVYAWGCPLLISMITFCIEKIQCIKDIVHIQPEFDNGNCWFKSNLSTYIYFYGPIFIILWINLMMLLHTTIIIYKGLQKSKDNFNGREAQKNFKNEKQRAMMYLKLFTISGGTWLGEILSAYMNSNSNNEYEPHDNLYIRNFFRIIDTINSLQGVSVFIIFVCTRSVLILINKKLCPKHQLFNTNSSKSNKTTSSTMNTRSSISRKNNV